MSRWLLISLVFAATGCGPPSPAIEGEFPAETSTGVEGGAASESGVPLSARSGAICRCPDQSLATYYGQADEVAIGQLVAAEPQKGDQLVEILLLERPWKIAGTRDGSAGVGDTLQYLTATSSAECGVELRVGAVYILFASTAVPPDALPRVQSCNGSRVFREGADADPQGFMDVPGPLVVSQLDALSGLDFLAEIASDSPREDDPTNDSLVGLLEIPAFADGGSLSIYETRSRDAAVVARIGSYEELTSREVDYEVGAAVVLAKVDGWYRVRLSGGVFGWVAPEAGGNWFPYADLPTERLTYLTGAWSGHVWPDPGAGLPMRSPRKGALDREEYPVEVLEAVDLTGTTWFRIAVLSEEPCRDGVVRPELGGWIPAYGMGGAPTVWFYSRGC